MASITVTHLPTWQDYRHLLMSLFTAEERRIDATAERNLRGEVPPAEPNPDGWVHTRYPLTVSNQLGLAPTGLNRFKPT